MMTAQNSNPQNIVSNNQIIKEFSAITKKENIRYNLDRINEESNLNLDLEHNMLGQSPTRDLSSDTKTD